MRIRMADVPAILGLAGVYALAARIGLSFDPVAGFATLVWPPSGIALAALVLSDNRLWPGVFIGATAANLLADAPSGVAVGIGLGNCLEALCGSILLRRVPRFTPSLETVHSAVGLIVVAAILSTAIGATIGLAALTLGGMPSVTRPLTIWQSWWVGDMVGVLLVAPIILVWRTSPSATYNTGRAEMWILSAAIIGISILTFFAPRIPLLPTPFHQADLLLAVLIWAALRLGQRGVVTATFYLSAVAVGATANGHGPFVMSDLRESLLALQTFLAIVAATCLLLGATIAERYCALDRARRAQADLAHADKAKSDFLAVMSHELRTPLNAIAGFTELVRSGVYGRINQKQKEALQSIERNERELLARIEAVLTFVQLEKGELTVRNDEVRVEDAFDAVEPVIASDVRRKQLVLTRELTAPALVVHADRKGLEQILTSLASNASKYSRDGGVITLGAEQRGERVRIWVRDSGVGITDEAMPNVFEPFFQGERGTTRRFAGVGLGLTIARELARRMRGELTIASEPGAGTTASVILPAA